MKLGANSVLFGGFDMETAFRHTAMAGYDGIEISAIDGMSEHLVLDRWAEIVPAIKQLSKAYGLPILAIEQPSQDPVLMAKTFQAAEALSCPVVNCGPGGKSGDEESLKLAIDSLATLAEHAQGHGVILCVKAHVGAAVYDTPTTLRVLREINHPAFGLDMDPSHIYRANEDPVEALGAVVDRIRHVHIRDCRGRQQGPGKPEEQANGRGEIDLLSYFRVLHENGYTGPVNLEIIGAKGYELPQCVAIASESRGHMQACLQVCGAR